MATPSDNYIPTGKETIEVKTDVATYDLPINKIAMTGTGTATPHIFHIASNGSDTSSDGSPARPFLTAQAAYTAWLAATSPKPVLRFGVGTFSIALSSDMPETLYVFGEGSMAVYNDGSGSEDSSLNASKSVLELSTVAANGSDNDSGDAGDGQDVSYAISLSSDLSVYVDMNGVKGGNGGNNTGGDNGNGGRGGDYTGQVRLNYIIGRGITGGQAGASSSNNGNPGRSGGSGGAHVFATYCNLYHFMRPTVPAGNGTGSGGNGQFMYCDLWGDICGGLSCQGNGGQVTIGGCNIWVGYASTTIGLGQAGNAGTGVHMAASRYAASGVTFGTLTELAFVNLSDHSASTISSNLPDPALSV